MKYMSVGDRREINILFIRNKSIGFNLVYIIAENIKC